MANEYKGKSITELYESFGKSDSLKKGASGHQDSKEYVEVQSALRDLCSFLSEEVGKCSIEDVQKANERLTEACGKYLDKKSMAFSSTGRERRNWISAIQELSSSVDYRDCNFATLAKEGKTWADATWDLRGKSVDIEGLTQIGNTTERFKTDAGFVTLESGETGEEQRTMARVNDQHTASRNVAASRLAEMLGEPDLLAKSVRVKVQDGDKTMDAVLMDKAKGIDYKSEKPEDLRAFAGASVSPEACRQISCLHIMDFVAGQVDRNVANMFYDVADDPQTGKKVINGIQGIDNDLSFGDLTVAKIGELVGSQWGGQTAEKLGSLDEVKFVDEDFLHTLKELKELKDKNPDSLTFMFGDLIDKGEQKDPQNPQMGVNLEALGTRLDEVVDYLDSPQVVKVKGEEGWEQSRLSFLMTDKYARNISDGQKLAVKDAVKLEKQEPDKTDEKPKSFRDRMSSMWKNVKQKLHLEKEPAFDYDTWEEEHTETEEEKKAIKSAKTGIESQMEEIIDERNRLAFAAAGISEGDASGMKLEDEEPDMEFRLGDASGMTMEDFEERGVTSTRMSYKELFDETSKKQHRTRAKDDVKPPKELHFTKK